MKNIKKSVLDLKQETKRRRENTEIFSGISTLICFIGLLVGFYFNYEHTLFANAMVYIVSLLIKIEIDKEISKSYEDEINRIHGVKE